MDVRRFRDPSNPVTDSTPDEADGRWYEPVYRSSVRGACRGTGVSNAGELENKNTEEHEPKATV